MRKALRPGISPGQRAFHLLRGQDLNLRPPGYEPGELPDCSTPRRGSSIAPVLSASVAARSMAERPLSSYRQGDFTMRVAAIDLGTNTTRLLVGDVGDGRVDPLVRRSRTTRLGEGVDARARLLPLPIARVRNCLSDYRRELESLGAERALLVATSAVRDAENGEAFLGEIEWSY